MNKNAFVIPGPETVIWWGVHVPLLSAGFGVAGIVLGHLMAPVIGAPLPLHRQAAVIFAGMMVSLGIAMATGQRPLIVLSWSIGIGFSGITIFQTMGAQAQAGVKVAGDRLLERLASLVAARKAAQSGAAPTAPDPIDGETDGGVAP